MAKLFFIYSAMNAGKTTNLLQVAYNYQERHMNAFLMTPAIDHRAGEGVIGSRIGLSASATTYIESDNLFHIIEKKLISIPIDCVLIDEAQFLTKQQVDQLANFVDAHQIPVMCYGLRTDFKGEFFPGSERLMAIADDLREMKTICWCGKKATMNLRVSEDGGVVLEGSQVQIGGNAHYYSVCRAHWKMKKTIK